MNIETINKSIRPITNLALIGDNDVSYIADLATNIMAGYDIHNDSMDSVADIISSTISRSNVNIVEMAESYKMAAGYLRMAGVDFTESSAAIGLLGNMGLKGTLAGTSLRALSTRFAKPTKEAQEVLDRLGIRFTEMRDIEGVQVEKLRPIADIFEELNKKGASMADVQAIFGKIGGNAAMMFLKNYDKLRELTSYNRGSQGVSSELALVKQNTTKGLWAQVTSQLTEGFMQAYEVLEPSIRTVLRTFLAKFKAPEFTRGLVSIGNALLDIFTVIGNIGAWVTRNFHWIEPLVFTGVVATRLFKVAGALTNIGIAMGFIGKQSAATTSISAVQGLLGAGGIGKVSFAQKRAIVSAMQSAGVAGRGSDEPRLDGRGRCHRSQRSPAVAVCHTGGYRQRTDRCCRLVECHQYRRGCRHGRYSRIGRDFGMGGLQDLEDKGGEGCRTGRDRIEPQVPLSVHRGTLLLPERDL